MARKAVKTISVTGLASSAGLLSAAPTGGYSTETDPISAYGDAWATNVPRTEGKSLSELTFEFLNEGDYTDDDLAGFVGTVVSVTVSATYGDGKGTDVTKTATFDFAVKSASTGSTSVDGERKSTITITGVRHSKANPAAASQSAQSPE